MWRQRHAGRKSSSKVERLQARAAQQSRDRGIAFKCAVAWGGDPARRIIQAAYDFRCDLIVVASCRRSAIGRLLWGDVATDLIAIAHKPVLVVAAPA